MSKLQKQNWGCDAQSYIWKQTNDTGVSHHVFCDFFKAWHRVLKKRLLTVLVNVKLNINQFYFLNVLCV